MVIAITNLPRRVTSRSLAAARPLSTASIDRARVTNPAPQSVYQTERGGAMRYTVDGFAPRSAHSVTLHFAEVVFNAARKRRFNVDINGSRVLTTFDIFSAAGAEVLVGHHASWSRHATLRALASSTT